MAKKVETEADAKEQLWSQLDDGRISMLSVPGSGQLPQPMTHFVDREAGCLWFISSAETDLVQAVNAVTSGLLVFMAPSQDYQASLGGRLEIVPDEEKLDALWNVAVAAWFEKGRDDVLVVTATHLGIYANEHIQSGKHLRPFPQRVQVIEG